MEITSIGVHPAYWLRGHGKAMAEWCVALGDMDKIPLGVTASPMGLRLFKSFGFEEAEYVVLKGYEHHPEPVSICFAIRSVGGREGALS